MLSAEPTVRIGGEVNDASGKAVYVQLCVPQTHHILIPKLNRLIASDP